MSAQRAGDDTGMGPTDEALVAYLLGALTPDEQAALEERYLCDEELFERLRAVEAELIDAYWRGRLSDDMSRRFEADYLSSPPRRERAALGRALAERATRPGGSRAGAAVAAAVVLGVTLGSLWHIRSRAPGSGEARNPESAPLGSAASLPPAVPSPRDMPNRAAAEPEWWPLSPGRARDAGDAKVLRPGTEGTSLEIELDTTRSGSPYRLVVQTAEGRGVWDASGLIPQRRRHGWALLVTVPAGVLVPGDYVLAVRSERGEDAAEYFFRIVD